MRILRTLLFVFFFSFVGEKIAAQDSVLVYKRNFKKDTIIDGKKYRVWDNWTNVGFGPCLLTNNPYIQLAVGLDFNFHIKQMYFNMGGFVSAQSIYLWNNYNVHLGYVPIRTSRRKFHYAVVTSVSISSQYPFAGPPNFYQSQAIIAPGFYAEFQYFRKLDWATGGGGTFFMDITKKNSVFGLRIDGFLSNAFHGYAPGHFPKNHQ